jgi:hypothetical protein
MKRIFNIPVTLVGLREALAALDGAAVLAKWMHWDKVCWLLDKLGNTQYWDKRTEADSYIPLQANRLREICGKRYADLMVQTLLENNIIESNNHYRVGNYSKGYRLTEEHRLARKVCVFNQNSKFLSKLEATDRASDGECYLKATLREELGIRYQTLLQDTLPTLNPASYAPYVGTNYTLSNECDLAAWSQHLAAIQTELSKLPTGPKKNNPRAQVEALVLAAGRIYTGQFFAHRDRKGRRLHTNVTNLASAGRKYLTLAGETELINTDIPASQLVFACVPLLQHYAGSLPPDVQRWVDLCTAKDAYEQLHIEMYRLHFDECSTHYCQLADPKEARKRYRKDFKSKFFAAIYYSELKFNVGLLATPESQFMWANYPSVMQWIVAQKQDDYAAFACNMQRAESDFVVDIFGYQAMRWMLPVVTIHDSALVPASVGRNVLDYFQAWLKEALSRADAKVKMQAECYSSAAQEILEQSYQLF